MQKTDTGYDAVSRKSRPLALVRLQRRRSLRVARISVLAVSAAVASLLLLPAANALGATQPSMGTAANAAILAGSTITNTGATVVTGNVSLSPGSAITGFPPGVVTGATNVDNATAIQEKKDLTTAYNDAQSAPSTSSLTGKDLGGMTLTPGVYTFASSAALTGALTLSGNGVFIFQMGSTLTTATASSVLLTGGAQACAVYWQVGSSATLGTATSFKGTILAQTSITLDTGANILDGRALAQTGAVTLDDNQVTTPSSSCVIPAAASSPTPTSTSTSTSTVLASPAPTSTSGGGTTTSVGTPNTGADLSLLVPIVAVSSGSALVAAGSRRRRR